MSELVNRPVRLPHAAPFLLLDRVIEIGERRGVFVKLVAAADPCLASDGTLPAAFVLEALAQAGGALLGELEGAVPAGYLAAVDEFRIVQPVRAGDQLRIEVELVRNLGGVTRFRGWASVADTVVAEGRFTLALPR